MTKDEALDLALEALEYTITMSKFLLNNEANIGPILKAEKAITAIKQARALDKMADNARELGLDYEPVGLIDRLTNPEDHYEFTDPKKANAVLMSLCQEAADALAAPVQPVAWQPIASAPKDGTRILCQNEKGLVNICEWTQCSATGDRFTSSDDRTFGSGPAYTSWMPLPQPIESTPPAAQPAPVQPVSGVVLRDGLPTLLQDKHIKETDQRLCIIPPAQPAPVQDCFWKREGYKECPAAQPAVPDAMTSADIQEFIEYVVGWNDCRAEMLKGMKP